MANDTPRLGVLVAQQILWLRRDRDTTSMQVLKLSYLSHGWMLGLLDEPLILEFVEAWQYGPVIPPIYHCYKAFGGDPIRITAIDHSEVFSEAQKEVIDEVAFVYQNSTALELSDITHKPGSPWDITRQSFGIGSVIPNELIRDHYKKLADE